MSKPSLTSPLHEFLFDCFKEYRSTLPNGGVISEKIWKEKSQEWIKAWDGRRKAKQAKRDAFVPPTPEEVTTYSAEIGYPMDGVGWCAHYATKKWKVGSNKMADWKAAVQKWKSNGYPMPVDPTAALKRKKVLDEPQGWLEFMQDTRPHWGEFARQETHDIKWDSLNRDMQAYIIDVITNR